jgi:hypothetical protein
MDSVAMLKLPKPEFSVAMLAVFDKLYIYLGSRKKDFKNAKQAVNRIIYILETTFTMKNPGIKLQPKDAILWFETMLERNYLLITPFCEHLEKAPLLSKPATVVGYMDSLSSAIKWLVFFYRGDSDGDISSDHIRRLTVNQISGISYSFLMHYSI